MNGVSKLIAITDGNRWFTAELPVQAEPPKPQTLPAVRPEEPRQVAPVDPIDEISTLLGRVIHIARGLSRDDARRAREIVYAASSALEASTFLNTEDQRRFEQGLRNGKTA
jgi:hypothetical protein